MSTADFQQPGSSPSGRTSGVLGWMKLVIALVFLLALAWVALLATQYFRTGKPIGDLPGVPPPVANLFKTPARYVNSFYGVQRPLGVAVASDGKVYVTESGGERKIRVFNRAGKEISSFAPPEAEAPSSIPIYVAVSPDGQIYVSDRDAGAIFIFTPDGSMQGTVPSPFGENEGWRPLGITFDGPGNLYVTDVTPGKHRLLVLDPEGRLTMQIGKEGNADGDFWFPNGVAVGEQGQIYVSDSNNGRVQAFDQAGNFLWTIGRGMAKGDLSLPRGIALDDDNHLFVVDTSRHLVQVYDISKKTPKFLTAFGGGQEAGNGGFLFPNGLALDRNGRIYVTDRENNRVQIWRY